MGDGSLSQEEIDALLQGADDLGTAIETPPAAAPAAAGLSDDKKNELRTFAQEVGESMGVTLSTVTAKTVEIKDPQIDVLDAEALKPQLEGKLVQITARAAVYPWNGTKKPIKGRRKGLKPHHTLDFAPKPDELKS